MARTKSYFAWPLLAVMLATAHVAAVSQTRGSSTGSLSYLRKKEGVGPWALWKTEPLRRRLLALLGPAEFNALQMNMDPAEPMTTVNGIMSSGGNRAHMGYEEEGVLIVDLDRDVAEVLMLHGGNQVRAWAERNQFVPLPPSILERMQHWPQPQLRQALAALQPASASQEGAPQGGLAAPAQSAGRQKTGSALDDIQAVFGGGDGQAPAPSAAATAISAIPSATVVTRLGQQFEVSGLRLGMAAAQAQGAAMTIEPKFQVLPMQFSLTDLPGVVFTSGVNDFTPTNRSSQNVNLGFTLAPRPTVLWGIGRIVDYDEDALPSISATITALRSKYRPESSYKENPIVHERSLIWLRDAGGNPVPQNQAAIIADACAQLGVAPQSSQSDIVSGLTQTLPRQMDCLPFTFLNATLVEWPSTRKDSAGRNKPAGLLLELKEQVMSYPLRRAGYEAASALVQAARQRRNRQERESSKGRSAPL